MKILITMMTIVTAALLSTTASGQIYESKDAEGVTEFSDTPTQGAEVVDLPTTNVVTPVAEPPMEAAPPAVPAPPPAPEYAGQAGGGGEQEGGDGDDAYYGGYGYDDNDLTPREQRRVDADRVENHMPAAAVGAEERAAEPGAGMGEPGMGMGEPGMGMGEPGMGIGEPGPGMRPEGAPHAGGGRR